MINSTGQTALLQERDDVTQLVEHYTEHELPRLAYSTQCAYLSYLKLWIVPTWGNLKLREVKAVQVEELAGVPNDGERHEGENQEHHVLALQPCVPMGIH